VYNPLNFSVIEEFCVIVLQSDRKNTSQGRNWNKVRLRVEFLRPVGYNEGLISTQAAGFVQQTTGKDI
jgi:hypothetical protein